MTSSGNFDAFRLSLCFTSPPLLPTPALLFLSSAALSLFPFVADSDLVVTVIDDLSSDEEDFSSLLVVCRSLPLRILARPELRVREEIKAAVTATGEATPSP